MMLLLVLRVQSLADIASTIDFQLAEHTSNQSDIETVQTIQFLRIDLQEDQLRSKDEGSKS